jgi:ABC-type Fe3+-hydroxamate transport system substrate-binding protein
VYYIDQIGNRIELQAIPKRIVSLVPSQTELLFQLGLTDEVVGITKFCIHPSHWFQSKARVGGTKQLHLSRIEALSPDLIIANKEENTKEQIEYLQSKYPVWVSDIYTLADAYQMIRSVGEICGKESESEKMVQSIADGFEALRNEAIERKTVLYLIWDEPLIGVGTQTFIHDVITTIGFDNILTQARYPEITPSKLGELRPDYIFLSSEPFPFKEKHREKLQILFPEAKIVYVDGEMFSWYGSRLQLSTSYFKTLLSQL